MASRSASKCCRTVHPWFLRIARGAGSWDFFAWIQWGKCPGAYDPKG
jgi:hypothetical protein